MIQGDTSHVDLRVAEDFLDGLKGAIEEVLAKLLDASMGDSKHSQAGTTPYLLLLC